MEQEDGSIRLTGIVIERGENCGGVRIDPKGMSLPKHVPVTLAFNDSDRVGVAKLSHDKDGNVIADIDIQDKGAYSKMYPAIGGMVNESYVKDKIRYITAFTPTSVGFSVMPNADPSIKTVGEQLKK